MKHIAPTVFKVEFTEDLRPIVTYAWVPCPKCEGTIWSIFKHPRNGKSPGALEFRCRDCGASRYPLARDSHLETQADDMQGDR